jgi:ABC-type polysaccharide/polyol phosphate export permease
MWIFSGIFFSTERFPAAIQPFVQALPLTALNDALRAVMLEGAGLAAIAGELLILGLWGAVTFVVALKLFRWQ